MPNENFFTVRWLNIDFCLRISQDCHLRLKAVRQVVAMRKDTALERADVPIVVVLLLVDVVNRSIVVH